MKPTTTLVPRAASPQAALAKLKPTIDAARAFRSAAKSPATRRAYASAWKLFVEWCDAHAFASLPAPPEVLCLYLTHMAATLKRKVSTIEQARAAISVAHQFAKVTNPSLSIEVKETMKGIRRTVGVAKKKKTPVLMEDMLAMLAATPSTGVDALMGRRDRALLAIGFTGAFRRSELVAIDIEHLTFEDEGVVVFVPRSKTDQEGEGRYVGIPRAAPAVLSDATTDNIKEVLTCPVMALEAWLEILPRFGVENGAVFRAVRGQRIGATRLTGESAAEIVKKYANLIGLDPKNFGGHSLRSGFATQSIMDGKQEADIMRQTGHKSVQVFRGYVRRASVFQNNAAKGVWRVGR